MIRNIKGPSPLNIGRVVGRAANNLQSPRRSGVRVYPALSVQDGGSKILPAIRRIVSAKFNSSDNSYTYFRSQRKKSRLTPLEKYERAKCEELLASLKRKDQR